MNIHATCLEWLGIGLLLRGPSGAGKSDLALRLMDAGAELVADDQTLITPQNGQLMACPPSVLAGLLEVRGIGIVTVPYRSQTVVQLVFDLCPADQIERLPDPDHTMLAGLALPRMRLFALEPSAPLKVRLAVQRVTGDKYAMSENAPSDQPACMNTPACQRVVIVTGLSGAGKTSALKVLEDLGYEAVDNLPVSLLLTLIRPHDALRRPLAVGIDIRTRDFAADTLLAGLNSLSSLPGLDVRMLFLECDDAVLGRRFTETRRRHPLAADRPLIDGIQHERTLVSPLKRRADVVVDTSDLAPGALKRAMTGHFALETHVGPVVFVTSFAYRNGLPREADLVFDARFLVNPHYVPELKHQTGRDGAVADYVRADPACQPFLLAIGNLLSPLLPRFQAEGKSYLTIAVGCTGGRHRSVFIAEELARHLAGLGAHVDVRHRELDMGSL